MTARKTPQPPAEAVSKDAHWAAKLDRLRNRKRPTATVTICDDHEVKQALAEATRDHARAQILADADPKDTAAQAAVQKAADKLATAQEAFDAEAIVLWFQAIEHEDLQTLMDAHPATEAQAEEGYDFNKDTLTPILVSESSMDGLTVDDAKHFLKTWGRGEVETLSNAVFAVQRDVRMDVGKG